MTTKLLLNFVTKLLLVTVFSKLDPGFQFYADQTSLTHSTKENVSKG